LLLIASDSQARTSASRSSFPPLSFTPRPCPCPSFTGKDERQSLFLSSAAAPLPRPPPPRTADKEYLTFENVPFEEHKIKRGGASGAGGSQTKWYS